MYLWTILSIYQGYYIPGVIIVVVVEAEASLCEHNKLPFSCFEFNALVLSVCTFSLWLFCIIFCKLFYFPFIILGHATIIIIRYILCAPVADPEICMPLF